MISPVVSVEKHASYVFLFNPRKLEIEGIHSAGFFNKTPRYDSCFVFLTYLIYLYGLIWSIVQHFSLNSVKSELENVEKVES